MLAAAAALYADSFYGMWAVIVALGFISAMFGPLKYGLLPVYLQADELVSGNAWFEAGSFIAIVTGTLVGARAAMGGAGRTEVGGLLLALGLIGCLSTYFLPRAPAAAAATISPWNPRSLRRSAVEAIGAIRQSPVLWRSVLGVSWFWCLGAVLLSFLPAYVKDSLHEDAAGVSHFLLFFAVGVGLGSFLGLFLNGGRIRATYVPVAGLAMSAFLFLWVLADRFAGAHLGLFLTLITSGIGIAGGVYSVPLYALMQHRSPVDQRGRVISANNIMNAVFMVAGAVGAIAIAAVDPRPAALLGVLGAANLAVSVYLVWLIPESVLQTVVRWALRIVFRVRVRGLENLPASGPRLIIANHTSWLDGALLCAFLPEPPVFAVDAHIAQRRWVKPFLKWTTAYSVDPTHPLSLKTLCAAVEAGGQVAIFPEGRLSTTGGLMKVYDGAGFIAHRTGARVIPIHIDGAHLSLFTRLGGKYRRRWFPRITLTIGAPQVMPPATGREGRTQFIFNPAERKLLFGAGSRAFAVPGADRRLAAPWREPADVERAHRPDPDLRADPRALGLPRHPFRQPDQARRGGGGLDAHQHRRRARFLGPAVRPPDSSLAEFHDGPGRLRLDGADGGDPDRDHGQGVRRRGPARGARADPPSRGREPGVPRGPQALAPVEAAGRVAALRADRPPSGLRGGLARGRAGPPRRHLFHLGLLGPAQGGRAVPRKPAGERRPAAGPPRLLAPRLRLQRAAALPRLRLHGRDADTAPLRRPDRALSDAAPLRNHPRVHLQRQCDHLLCDQFVPERLRAQGATPTTSTRCGTSLRAPRSCSRPPRSSGTSASASASSRDTARPRRRPQSRSTRRWPSRLAPWAASCPGIKYRLEPVPGLPAGRLFFRGPKSDDGLLPAGAAWGPRGRRGMV